MSLSNLPSEPGEEAQGDMNDSYVPRKFVFDGFEDNPKLIRTISKESATSKNNTKATIHMPYVFNFPEPANYKESYSKLVKHILNIYNQVRILIVEVEVCLFEHSNILATL